MSPFSTWANYPHHKPGGHIGNFIGTHWELGKNEKNPSPSKLKGKQAKHLMCMLGSSHWLHEFIFPKKYIIIFGLG
jgi:hypothetical protein